MFPPFAAVIASGPAGPRRPVNLTAYAAATGAALAYTPPRWAWDGRPRVRVLIPSAGIYWEAATTTRDA